MQVSAFVGVSLDGFIARKDLSFDILPEGEYDHNGFGAFVATVDAHVIGRRTFDWAAGLAKWPYRKPVIVLSRSPARVIVPAGADCTVMTATPKQVVSRLARRGVKHIYVDGGQTIQNFLRANLVDRIIINRYPVLIGDGIPLFGVLPHDLRLKHVRTRSYPKGLVKSEYRLDRR
ncbi:MAG TPA: dihydrofolate reductase family protein [Thermoplasmata archaeon]|nr:dihydrofolate reductase family protein [Thermoplasmata archaeon]